MPRQLLLKILEGAKKAGKVGAGFTHVNVTGMTRDVKGGQRPRFQVELISVPPGLTERAALEAHTKNQYKLTAFVTRIKPILVRQRESRARYVSADTTPTGATLFFHPATNETEDVSAHITDEELQRDVETLKKQFQEAGIALTFTPTKPRQ